MLTATENHHHSDGDAPSLPSQGGKRDDETRACMCVDDCSETDSDLASAVKCSNSDYIGGGGHNNDQQLVKQEDCASEDPSVKHEAEMQVEDHDEDVDVWPKRFSYRLRASFKASYKHKQREKCEKDTSGSQASSGPGIKRDNTEEREQKAGKLSLWQRASCRVSERASRDRQKVLKENNNKCDRQKVLKENNNKCDRQKVLKDNACESDKKPGSSGLVARVTSRLFRSRSHENFSQRFVKSKSKRLSQIQSFWKDEQEKLNDKMVSSSGTYKMLIPS